MPVKPVSKTNFYNFFPKTIRGAVKARPDANVVVISVAGRYAVEEAWIALRLGLHVLLFSDNIALADEILLKEFARDQGLLMMGAGAGTAILNGVALGFSNVLPQGVVGIVSASGTGIQEVGTLLALQNIGITQCIGTGGRDLKEEVGGIMMLEGLKALQEDVATKVIILISKPPSSSVVRKVLSQAVTGKKPTVVCLLGVDEITAAIANNIYPVTTLEETALVAARLAGAKIPNYQQMIADENHKLEALAKDQQVSLSPQQRYLRALFSGGTFCYEAQVIWRDLLREPVFSNVPLDCNDVLKDLKHSSGHTALDLGTEEFLSRNLHPMINNDVRIHRLMQEARDPEVAVIMLDMVLGYGVHPDPASALGPAIQQARQLAAREGRELVVVASVTGSDGDPQNLSGQVKALEASGAIVCQSNAAAARLTGMIVE